MVILISLHLVHGESGIDRVASFDRKGSINKTACEKGESEQAGVPSRIYDDYTHQSRSGEKDKCEETP
jgi:hypothetical protein